TTMTRSAGSLRTSYPRLARGSRLDRVAGVVQQPPHGDGLEMVGLQGDAQLAHDRLRVGLRPDGELDYLAGVNDGNAVVAVVELDRARDQLTSRPVRQPPLANAWTVRGVQEVVAKP